MTTSSRPTSSASITRPFRFSQVDDASRRSSTKRQEPQALSRTRTSSLPPRSGAADPFTAHPSGSASFVTYETETSTLVSPAQSPATQSLASLPKRARGSLLLAASGLSFGRPKSSKGKKKRPDPPAQSPFMFSEVIEISAPPRTEDEDEERERLRDAAAQSIGLDPVLLEERSISEEDETRTTSTTPTPSLPPFPSSRVALEPFEQLSARIPKHYPPPSLLMFALSRQWKMRFLILTSTGQREACLHVFKHSGPDERELERLEIGADSRAFVAEEEVGGRRGVVKVGGTDGTEMTLQIVDQDQAQSWIAAIKQAVLSQRSARAGLGYMSHSPSGFEPRGDLDVMLSMRAQGMLSSPTSSTFSPEISGPSQSQRSASVTRSSSTAVSALRGLFTGSGSRPRSPSSASTATGDLDGDLETQHDDSFGKAGTSLLSMLRSNSVSSERPTSPALSTAPHSPSTPSTPRAESQALVLAHLDRKILQDKDMELVEARASTSNGHGNGIASLITGGSHIAAMRGFGSPSLQPPPRRRAWTSSGVPMGPRARPDGPSYAYTHHNGSHAESFGLRQTNGSTWFSANPPASPKTTGTGSSNSHGEARPRTSTSSVSSYASASPEPRTSSDLGSSKRWSRQGTLPRRLTPPDGLPPAPPPSQSPPSYRSSMQRHPYAAETTPSRSPSVNSSPQSRGLGQQNFSKRASGSSAHSVSTVSTTHSRGGGSSHIGHHRPMSSHRTSVPPPQRPAPIAALPPTPCEGTPATKPPNSAPSAKTSLRQSLSLRTNRLSLSPPTLPPSSSLPPRPDEPGFRFHRRSTSNGSATLSPIPASPTPLVPPFPPPSGPLPPTPEAQPTSRAASIKQRLRMLSAPAPLPPPPTSPPAPPHPPSPIPSTINPYSVPSTPIGEPITTLQNDPTFLFSSPPTPPLRSPLRSPSPEPSPELNGMTSLSPPPRRGSRRISPQDEEDAQERPSTADAAGTDVNHHHMSLSLSPPSAISLVNV